MMAEAETTFPASVVVHDLSQARRVLRAARQVDRPVHLISAKGAGAYLGPALFKEIIDQAREAEPSARATCCLDCGDEAGTAMNALRHGVEGVSLDGSQDVIAKVRDAAEQKGQRLDPRPEKALDMAAPDSSAVLEAWLLGDTVDD